ncbi:hypothetical protein [uncultured Imperialibacter sp.]|uniref:hypothetical protein n=1 Tax=uncultured Imperialibacter sp. TaxID=1672639 RepID=UPI0030DCEFD3
MRSVLTILILVAFFIEAPAQKFELDTSYLPVQKFQHKLFDRDITDSLDIYFKTLYLKAFDEPPLFCCGTDSTIRILTIPSFSPPTLAKIQRQNSEFVVVAKIGNKVGLDNSYYDPSKLRKRELAQFNDLMDRFNSGDFTMTSSDSAVYHKALVIEDEPFDYSVIKKVISVTDWRSMFELVDKAFYERPTNRDQNTIVEDGYGRMTEVWTSFGYHVLSRSSATPEESAVLELIHRIEKQIE